MTNRYFSKIKDFLLELGFDICHADEQDGVFVVDKPELGIKNLVLGCGDPLLLLERYRCNISTRDASLCAA